MTARLLMTLWTGTVSVTTTGSVTVGTVGDYTLTYSATDVATITHPLRLEL